MSVATIYVAKSKALAEWGAAVGLTKHVYKIGLAEGTAEAAIKALNDGAYAGLADWQLVKKAAIESGDEAAALAKLARKEEMIDPAIYPKLKGAGGIFKVRPKNVAHSIMVRKALAGEAAAVDKVSLADIAEYMILNVS